MSNNEELHRDMDHDTRVMRLANMAYDETEKRLREGRASNTLLVQMMKYGSKDYQLSNEKLKMENEMLKAKIAAVESATASSEDSAKILAALSSYQT